VPIEFQPAFVDELQDQERGELLRHRPDFKLRASVVRDVPLPVRETKSTLIEDVALPGDEDRTAEIAVSGASLHDPVYSCRRILGLC